MEWISDASARPPGVLVGSHLTNHESSNLVRFPPKTVPSRLRIAIRSLSCDAMRTTSRDDATVSMRARIGAMDFVPSRNVGLRVRHAVDARVGASVRTQTIDRWDGWARYARSIWF